MCKCPGGLTVPCSLTHREPGAMGDTMAGKAEAALSRATSHCPGRGKQGRPASTLSPHQQKTLW